MPELKTWLQKKIETFKGGCISDKINEWKKLTSDLEILQTVQGLTLDFLEEEPPDTMQQVKSGQNSPQIMEEVKKLLNKGVVVRTVHETGEFISPIFLRTKPD